MSKQNNKKSFRDLIETLVNTVELDDLAARLGIPIKKKGAETSAQCIFHEDKDPSMVLYRGAGSGKPHFHCFVCNAHGDIFDLVKKNEGLDFSQSVKWLAQSYGLASFDSLASKSNLTGREKSKSVVPQNIYAAQLAYEIYATQKDTQLLNWLVTREIDRAVAEKAELQFAKSRTLVNHIQTKISDYGTQRENLGILIESGYIRPLANNKTDTGSSNFLNLSLNYRDFFDDGRVIFPIRDLEETVLGFAGRKINNDSPAPKYLYTPNLQKSHVLYRANFAFSQIKAEALRGGVPTLYLCEGLLDALRLESLGVTAVAVLGSKLSEIQAKLIVNLGKSLSDSNPLQVRFFFDSDAAGLKGAASSIETLIKIDEEVHTRISFVWPSYRENDNHQVPKDPDELFKGVTEVDYVMDVLKNSQHPAALALLASHLKVWPDEILNDDKWSEIPIGAKYRISLQLRRSSNGLIDRILDQVEQKVNSSEKWITDVKKYIESSETRVSSELAANSPEQISSRLNLARELAQSGAIQGEVLADIASWRRISLAATAFNEGFKSRLRQQQFQPTEPFDAIFVSRGFGNNEARLKAMPCPEDLVIQQYLLNEILTEGLDNNTIKQFSNHIPAVRFYRSLGISRTTGEGGVGEIETPLSFAYQIDMDLLEDRSPSKDSGFFRPYFECWKEFIGSLMQQGEHMENVHMVRLDFKRYYDNIRRDIVKNVLRQSLIPAYGMLDEDSKSAFAPLFQPMNMDDERYNGAIDLLLEHSFGFPYFHPNTGVNTTSDREIGIPQGPVLSAWLGNIVLFKLDAVMRAKLKELNRDGIARVGYARYVDDVVLIGESNELLSLLRGTAEDVARSLELVLIAKESFAPMTGPQFLENLTAGRALTASGPREETILLESGDGDAGWSMWHTEKQERQSSLELLRDPRLYSMPPETIQNQVFTALRASDLRPAELSKAARWLWFQVAKSLMSSDYDESILVENYWHAWNLCVSGISYYFDEEASWDDPAFYALEGLESLFERANNQIYGLDPDEENARVECIAKLAKVAKTPAFVEMFLCTSNYAPIGWSIGVRSLPRMFYRRLIGLRWKAARLSPENNDENRNSVVKWLSSYSDVLQASLRRSLTTDAETWGIRTSSVAATGHKETEQNVLHDAFLWLHDAVVSVAGSSNNDDDPINYLRDAYEEIATRSKSPLFTHFFVFDDQFIPLLGELLPHGVSAKEDSTTAGKVVLLALQTLSSIAPRKCLATLLANRWHLLQKDEHKIPLPPLPGLPADGLLLVSAEKVENQFSELSKLWWATVGSNDDFASFPSFKVVISGNDPERVKLIWKKVETIGNISLYSSKWPVEIPSIRVLRTPSAFSISPSSLSWAADIFEAVAKLNAQSSQSSPGANELVPAWPYLATNNWPADTAETSLTVILLSLEYSTALLDGQAYVRNGLRGLQSYEISQEYGKFWRTGVMLSDVFGFAQDLDQYAALKFDSQNDSGVISVTEPSAHLLRNVLSKLRGKFYSETFLRPQPGKEYLPATIARSLSILRQFPTDGLKEKEIAFVLASETETIAMQLRLNSFLDVNRQGLSASFLERVAVKVLNRIPLGWADHLNSAEQIKLPKKLRSLPRTYLDLGNRLEALTQLDESSACKANYSAFVTGLRIAGITSWLRELVFICEGITQDKDQNCLIDGDLNIEWGIEEGGFLSDKPEAPLSEFILAFRSLINQNAPQQAFIKITPLGWIALLAGLTGLTGTGSRSQFSVLWNNEDLNKINGLAKRLAKSMFLEPTKDIHPDWPFELNSTGGFEGWEHESTLHLVELLELVESKMGLQFTGERLGNWRLDLSDNSFTDTESVRWQFQRWQISVAGGTRPSRISIGKQLLSQWDETRDHAGNLVFVSALNDKLAKLMAGSLTSGSAVDDTVKESSELVRNTPRSPEPASGGFMLIESMEEISTEIPKALVQTDLQVEQTKSADSVAIESDIDKTMLKWRSLQDNSWSSRKYRSSGHTRIALMQWRLDETYHHPVIDDDNWKNKEEWPKNELSSSVNSKKEARRRQFISEALFSCDRFGVDLLVLPEYSVRPDTVKWLREQLAIHAYKVSVLAGTYKLHGNASDVKFSDTFSEILGVVDSNQVLGNKANSDNKFYSSGEHSAVITLLTPMVLNTGENLVCTFSRRKKYPSLAADEAFSPLLGELKPLFSVKNFLGELRSRSKSNKRTEIGKGIDITAEAIIDYHQKFSHLECLAEFICSELFLPMSPVNHSALASELHKLLNRFGSPVHEKVVEDSVLEDLKNMGEYMGMSNSKGSRRRSIYMVPSMTTRSADYWIFGQAALLAGGATTVFCNAVAEKYAIGQSCFIGRNSWTQTSNSAHYDTATPYAGWSKGIFYNEPSDALGTKEQAIVIADVDPTFMQEGKPRPQALAIPLQLVAYLPILEVSDANDREKANKIADSLENILLSPPKELMSKATGEVASLETGISELLKNTDDGAFAKRFNHWKAYGRANPIAGVPPTLVDWIYVNSFDLKPVEVFLPKCKLEEGENDVLPD